MGKFSDNVVQAYEQTADNGFVYRLLCDDSPFVNFGYWREDTANAREAGENLVDELLKFLPDRKGKILDVACGQGAISMHLCQYYVPNNVVGINISTKQLRKCREIAPDCTFLEMDATQLEFEESSFDNVICVEAAFHFDTREKFLSEACRVLKPGGRLVMADISSTKSRGPESLEPEANLVTGSDGYAAVCRRAGFADVKLVDVTDPVIGGFAEHAGRTIRQRLPWLAARPQLINGFVRKLDTQWRCRTYVLVACVKPVQKPANTTRRGGVGR